MSISTNLWDRLLEVLEAENLDQAAEKLNINPSTLRGRKSRGAIPYDEIVQKLDAEQLAYVFKDEHLYRKNPAPAESKTSTVESAKEIIKGLASEREAGYATDPKDLHYELSKSAFENFVAGLMQRIEDAPFSKEAKLQIIDSVIRIVGEDLKQVRQEKEDSDEEKDS